MDAHGEPHSPAREARYFARGLLERGDEELARQAQALAEQVESWESAWRRRVTEVLAAHHEMNNALTGVFGNAQLVLLGPASELPGVRQRMESLLREAERLRDATSQLRALRQELQRAEQETAARPHGGAA
jgi:signal transduction histidine kinase